MHPTAFRMPSIEPNIDRLEELLRPWRPVVGSAFKGYRNHVYRMVHFCVRLLESPTHEERQKILIAGAFHDIGLWVDDTVDYIDPSVPPALEYLDRNGLSAWSEEIETMIREHHKITPYRGRYPLVEVFRRGDLADVSLGWIRFGLPSEYVTSVKRTFPNAGFHAFLARRWLQWIVQNPLHPAPMMKW